MYTERNIQTHIHTRVWRSNICRGIQTGFPIAAEISRVRQKKKKGCLIYPKTNIWPGLVFFLFLDSLCSRKKTSATSRNACQLCMTDTPLVWYDMIMMIHHDKSDDTDDSGQTVINERDEA